MIWKLVQAVVVGIVVAIVIWLVAQLLLSFTGSEVATSVGSFLDRVNEIVGLLAALWFFFFGGKLLK